MTLQEVPLETTATSSVVVEESTPASSSPLTKVVDTLKMVFGVSSLASFWSSLKKEVPALLNVKAYSRPAGWDDVKIRIRANAMFFKLFYAVVFLSITALLVLSSPVLFIFGACLGLLWSWVLRQNPEESTVIFGKELGAKERMLGASVLSVLFVVLGGIISTGVYILLVNGVVIGLHASFREPVVLDALDIIEQENEALKNTDLA